MGEIWNAFIGKTKELYFDLSVFNLRQILKLFWNYDHKGEEGLKRCWYEMVYDSEQEEPTELKEPK